MRWRHLLILLAVVAVYLATWHLTMRYLCVASLANSLAETSKHLPGWDVAECCYPYNWQEAERERLRALLERAETPPTGNDELGLARYAAYALDQQNRSDYEAILREGMHRDPPNALYHYLLANHLVRQAIAGDPPRYDDATQQVTYFYRVKDRAKFERAMAEVAAGMALPLNIRRDMCVHMQLAVLPLTFSYDDRLRDTAVLFCTRTPEYSQFRNLARVNGYYISRLLDTGETAEAVRAARFGERIGIQISEDQSPTLIGMLVAQLLCAQGTKNTAAVYRAHGMEHEAAALEHRYQVLMGEIARWKDRGKAERSRETDFYRTYAGIFPTILLPSMAGQRDWITPEALRPGRLLDYTVFEEVSVVALSAIFLLLLIYAGLKAWRWRLATRGQVIADPGIRLPARVWAQALGWGFLLPLALYLVYTHIPALSGRNYSIRHSVVPLLLGVKVFGLWMLVVPTSIMAGAIWRVGEALGCAPEIRRNRMRLERATASFLAMLWSMCGLGVVVALPILVVLPWVVDYDPLGDWLSLTLQPFAAVGVLAVVGGLVLVPAVWERRRPHLAPFYRALCRAFIPLYAVLALLTVALYPALRAYEHRLLQQDRVTCLMDEQGVISFTRAEGQLVLKLRDSIRRGAQQLAKE